MTFPENNIKISKTDKELHEKIYRYFDEHGIDDGWVPGSKEFNFELLTKIQEFTGVRLRGSSCLDVGCGTGDLSRWLRNQGISHYRGFDLLPFAIAKAKAKYPKEVFVLGDFLASNIAETYDYAFASGTFALSMENNYSIVEAALKKMWELSRIGLAFNLLTADKLNSEENTLFYYDPEKILDTCKNIDPTAKVEVITTDAGTNHSLLQGNFYMWN